MKIKSSSKTFYYLFFWLLVNIEDDNNISTNNKHWGDFLFVSHKGKYFTNINTIDSHLTVIRYLILTSLMSGSE